MSIILISGTPGSGKTTLASQVAKHGYDVFSIDHLAELFDAKGPRDQERNAVLYDIELIHDALLEWEHQPGTVVEGHYADVIPDTLLLHCFILNPSIEVLRPRLEERGYLEDKIQENIEAHIMQECLYDAIEYYGRNQVTQLGGTDRSDDLQQVLDLISKLS